MSLRIWLAMCGIFPLVRLQQIAAEHSPLPGITAVQTPGGHLSLCNRAVRPDDQRLSAHLTGIIAAMGQPMIKNIPLSPNALHAAVGGARGIATFILLPSAAAHITITYQRTPVAKISVRAT